MFLQYVYSFCHEKDQDCPPATRIRTFSRRIARIVCISQNSQFLLCKHRSEHERARYRILVYSSSISHITTFSLSLTPAGFYFDPSTVDLSLTSSYQNDDDDDKIEMATEQVHRESEARIMINSQAKQSKLREFWN